MGWRRPRRRVAWGKGSQLRVSFLTGNEEAFCFLDSPPLLRLYWSMLANSRHQWNRLGHYARSQAWICRLVGLEEPALHSFDVGSFFLSLVFFRNHAVAIRCFLS